MITMHSLIALWKIIWLKIPYQLFRRIEIEEDFTVTTARPRLQTVQLGYIWRATCQWNLLPIDIRSIRSLQIFKRRLRAHIISSREGGTAQNSSRNEMREEGEGRAMDGGGEGGGGDGGVLDAANETEGGDIGGDRGVLDVRAQTVYAANGMESLDVTGNYSSKCGRVNYSSCWNSSDTPWYPQDPQDPLYPILGTHGLEGRITIVNTANHGHRQHGMDTQSNMSGTQSDTV